jgi:hypothetical protein
MLSSWLRGINGNERKWGRDAARPKRIAVARPYMHDERRLENSTSPASIISILTRTHAATRGYYIGRRVGWRGGGSAAKSKRSHIRARVRNPGVQADANSASAVHDVHYSEIRAGALRSPRDRAPAQGTTARSLTCISLPSGPVQSTWRPAPSSRTTRSEIQ